MKTPPDRPLPFALESLGHYQSPSGREDVGIVSHDTGTRGVYFTLRGTTIMLPRHARTTDEEIAEAADAFLHAFRILDKANHR